MDESDDLLVPATADCRVVAPGDLTRLDGAVAGRTGNLGDDGLDVLLDRVDPEAEGVAEESDGFREADVADDGAVGDSGLELLGGVPTPWVRSTASP